MKNATDNKKIISKECRFATYCRPSYGERTDLHVIKEILHYEDGTSAPNMRLIYNFERPFWVTKKGFRNHKEKKEWEKTEKLDQFRSTQSQLNYKMANALGMMNFRDPRQITRSPYLYGADISSTAIIKQSYMQKYQDKVTPYLVAGYDIETDVLHGTKEIIIATATCKNKVITTIKKSFVEGHTNVIPRLRDLMEKYLSEVVKERKIEWEVHIVDNEYECVKGVFDQVHIWKPDFVTIWNINFDIPKTINAIERAGYDPKDIFSDPIVPKEFRSFKYIQGPNKKITSAGKMTSLSWYEQWHTVLTPSSFTFVDGGCAYYHIRMGEGKEPSYSLDNILDKHLGIRKLKFKEAEGLTGIDRHLFMQEKYPLEYVIYNVFDNISMELLDEETNDLQLTLPKLGGCSDFSKFKSQPRRVVEDIHWFTLQNQHVIGTTSDELKNEMDEMTVDCNNWIIMLPSELTFNNGLKLIKEDPTLTTNIHIGVGDLDVAASYPNGGIVFNISKETTFREIINIDGISEKIQRQQGINMSGGRTNAVEICCQLYGLPSLPQMLESFEKHLNTVV